MLPAFSPTFHRVLPTVTWERLLILWRSLAERGGDSTHLLIDPDGRQRFALLLAPRFQALLKAESVSPHHEAVWLTQSKMAIADFIHEHQLTVPETLASSFSAPLDHPLQEQLLLGLLEILNSDSLNPPPKFPSLLELQSSQDKVLSQVIAQIRQSLDLSVILHTAVTEVRQFIFVDRLVIYQFQASPEHPISSEKPRQRPGQITYEARISADIPSMLDLVTENDCFSQVASYEQRYLKGDVVAVNDIESHYSSSYCLIRLLQQYQVRAKLVAPIRVDNQLWGLLIAHQCHHPRQWLESEKNFLGQIGEHLAVAIVQAKLYAEVQEQKQTFEKRVIERTKDLRDTLLAAQAANHLKVDFLNNITHELRTPLTCVIGLSGTLLHWSNKGIALPLEKQQRYLEMIQEGGKRLMELINGIIELSRLESGQSILKFQMFSLHSLAQRMVYNLEAIAIDRQITLELDFQIQPEQDQFCADPERLEQILSHVLNNALKFTPSQGRVVLRIWKENKQAVFQIEDTGVGIADHQFPFLFEAFKQLTNNHEKTYEGSGVGLALTKQLVELHGGRIEVDSMAGKGAIFTIFIPQQNLSTLKKINSQPLDTKAEFFNSGVVVIENDEEIATLICELLTAANFQVIWLIETANSVKQIELLQPGIVLIDQDFKNVNQVSRLLKSSHRITNLKVVLLSEHISSAEWQTFSQNGIDDYLLKPLQPDLLLQRLNVLRGSSGEHQKRENFRP